MKSTTQPHQTPARQAPEKMIGRRIKRLRVQQARTQEDIASACHLTKSMMSKIESGSVYPSVASLARIAAALGTNVSALMEQRGNDHPIFVPRAEAETSLTKSDKGYSTHPYATEFVDKKMQPFLFVVKKGEVKRHVVSHPGEEFVFVVEGEILFKVGDTEFRLRQGDALFFHSLDEHGVMPVTDEAKYIDVFVGC